MNIAVIYNLVDALVKGKEQDRLADCEVVVTAQAVKTALEKNGHKVSIVNIDNDGTSFARDFDAIFNLAESTVGSNLTDDVIAGKLQEMGVPFTGSGAETLRLCTDKEAAKAILSRHGILTPRYQVFASGGDIRTPLAYPLIVKPVHEDGSIGITNESVVFGSRQLQRLVTKVQRLYKQPALVEEFIDGREINVAIIGHGEHAHVLPLSEIVFTLRPGLPKIVSFEAKWVPDSHAYCHTDNACPADLDPETAAAICAIGARAYQIMGCEDYARVDIRLRGTAPYVLEVNPNPCINPDGAGFIASANAAGFSYNGIINEILASALSRASVALAEVAQI